MSQHDFSSSDLTNRVDGIAPVFAGFAADTLPLPFFQAKSEVPTGPTAVVIPSDVQLTARSARIRIARNAVIASHWLNLPLTDMAMDVSRLYKKLKIMAFNWQREHRTAFFSTYPEAAILSSAERTMLENRFGGENEWLRQRYEILCLRLAHYIYHYRQFKMFQVGALAELNLLTRLNGNERTKRIASDVRWTWINSACRLAERFPVIDDIENYVISNSAYAIGKTTYGADVVSIPMWIVDCYGNRGRCGLDPQMGVNIKSDGTSHPDDMATWDNATPGWKKDKFLTPGSLEAYYGANSNRDPTDPNTLIYSMIEAKDWMEDRKLVSPFIENGSTWHALYTDTGSETLLNKGVEFRNTVQADWALSYDRVSPVKANGNLTSRYWNAFEAWSNYGLQAFQEMLDPNSDIYVLVSQVTGVKSAMKLEKFNSAIRAVSNVDMTDLASKMQFNGPSGSSVNMSTVISYKPMVHAGSRDAASRDYGITQDLTDDLMRCRADVSDVGLVIASADAYPRFTPTVFPITTEGSLPLVVNSTITLGDEASTTEGGRFVTPTGRYATLVDLATNAQTDYESNRIKFVGVSKDVAMNFASARRAAVYEEDPSNIHVWSMPLFNTSDPLQCGFNIMISVDEVYPSEWANYFLNKRGLSEDIKDYVGLIDSKAAAPAFKKEDDKLLRRNVIADKYLHDMCDAFVFVGGAVFSHPVMTYARRNCGWLTSKISNLVAADHWFTKILDKTAGAATVQAIIRDLTILDGASVAELRSSETMMTQLKDGTDPQRKAVVYAIAPEYGPFTPIMNECAAYPINGYVAPIYSLSWAAASHDKSAATPGLPPIELTSGSTNSLSFSEGSLQMKRTLDPFITPLNTLGWYLDEVSLHPMTLSSGTPQPSSCGRLLLEFSDLNAWAFRMMSCVVVENCGFSEFQSFWTAAAEMAPKQVVFRASSQFPENNEVAEPRVVRAQGARSNSSYPTGSVSRLQSQDGAAASSFKPTSNPSGKGSRRRRSKPRDQMGKSGGYKDRSRGRDDEHGGIGSNKDPSSILISEDGVSKPLGTPTEGSKFDTTSSATDARVKKSADHTSSEDNKKMV